MTNFTDWYEKIEDYLKNRLTEADKAAFETEMADDPDLAQEVALHRAIMETTPSPDVLDLRALMDESYTEWKAENLTKEQPQSSFFSIVRGAKWAKYAAAAAVVGLALVAVWKLQTPTPDNPLVVTPPIENPKPAIDSPPVSSPPIENPKPADNRMAANYAKTTNDLYKPYQPEVLMSDDKDTTALALNEATRLYQEGQWRKVVAGLLTLPSEGRTNALKLRAHARFKLQRYAEAALDFEELCQSLSSRRDAEWYLLLCYAAQLPKTRARYEAQLVVVTANGHPHKADALALQEKINKPN